MVRFMFVVCCLVVSSAMDAAEQVAPEVWEQESVVCELAPELIYAIALTPDNNYLAVGSWTSSYPANTSSMLRLFRLSDGQSRFSIEIEEEGVTHLFFTPDGQTLLGRTCKGNLFFQSAVDGSEINNIRTDIKGISSMALNPCAFQLAVQAPAGSQSRTIGQPAIAVGGTPKRNWESQNQRGYLPSIRLYDCEGNHLFDLGYDNGNLTTEEEFVTDLAFSPDGRLLASIGWDGNVRLWDLATRTATIFEGGFRWGTDVAFSPDGVLLAGAGHGTATGVIRRWNVATGKSILALKTPPKESVDDLAFSPDSQLLASGNGSSLIGGVVRLWNMAGGKQIPRLDTRDPDTQKPQANAVNNLIFDASGRLFSSDSAGRVIIWRRAGETVASVKAPME